MSGSFFSASGVRISLSGTVVPLSEIGVFDSIPTGYTVDVVGSSQTNPLSIFLRDSSGVIRYSQFMVLPRTTKLMDITEYTESQSDGLIITPRS